MTSVHKQILDKIQTEIVGLTAVTSVFESAEIVVRKAPWDLKQVYRGVTIWGRGIQPLDGTIGADDYAYRCVVSLIAPNEDSVNSQLDRFPQIEEAIRRHFHDKRRVTGLTLATGIQPGICKFVPDVRIDPPRKAEWTNPVQVEWQHSLILVHCREVRP